MDVREPTEEMKELFEELRSLAEKHPKMRTSEFMAVLAGMVGTLAATAVRNGMNPQFVLGNALSNIELLFNKNMEAFVASAMAETEATNDLASAKPQGSA